MRVPSRAPSARHVPRTIRLLRFASSALIALVAAACLLLLAVRFVAFPRIETHQDAIANALAQRIGQPIAIDAIVTGWDGWNPRLSVRGFKVGDPAHPVLELPRVDLVVAWTSLPLLQLHLKELALEGPRLAVRRDPAGRLHVAGIEIDPERPPDDNGVTDWLLRQREIVIRDGLVSWKDDLRNAPQLVLDHVQLRIEQGFGRHRFGLTGVPPAELSSPIDLRGEMTAASLRNWQNATGRLYLRLDYADVAAWQEWLPLPFVLDSGKGALRVWLDFAKGKRRQFTADFELADVRARLAQGLAPLDLGHVAGRVGGTRDGGHVELFTKGLRFSPHDGTVAAATDLTLSHDDVDGEKPAHTALSFDHLDLAPMSALAAEMPLPERLREVLAGLALHGSVQRGSVAFDGPPDAPLAYQASAGLVAVGFHAQGAWPGATGLSGKLDADQTHGSIKLNSRDVVLDLPHVLAEPLHLQTLSTNTSWDREDGALRVRVDGLEFANPQVSGKASASWRALPVGPGEIDLKAQVPHFDSVNLPHYLPLILHQHLREWLRRVVVKGTATDIRVTLHGNLAHFPFDNTGEERFEIAAKAHGAVLDYAEGWPPVNDVDGELRFAGRGMQIDATAGQVYGVKISRARATIPDLADPQRSLRIEGEAAGPSSDFLAVIARSPAAGWIQHATDEFQAAGEGTLGLAITLPLADFERFALAGEYRIADNDVRIPGLPPLARVNGTVAFTEKEVRTRDVSAEALGGRLTAQVVSAPGGLRVTAAGSANVAQLKGVFDAPLIERASGIGDWQFALQTQNGAVAWTLDSSLKGVTIDMPAPLGKRAAEAAAVRVERRELRPTEDQLTIDYANAGRLILHRRLAKDDATVDRALLVLGKGSERATNAERSGVWVRGQLPELDADAWLAFYRSLPSQGASKGDPGISLDAIDLQAASLHALGRDFTDLQMSGRRIGADWRLSLQGREMDGGAVWRGPSPTQPNGHIVARLARLTIPPAVDTDASSPASPPASQTTQAWPEMDVAADAFESHGHALGKLEFLAAPKGNDWQIRKLALSNDAGRIDASGWWRLGATQETSLDVVLDVQDAAAFLARFALPDTVKGATTHIEGKLAWPGAPSDFDYRMLNGMFRVTTGPGQFIKADPGVGRLLGVLSLQSLPRRITLDFHDIFSEGFSFDSLSGSVRIDNGVMHSDDLHMVGPAAAIDISGDADLEHETQQLRVKVQPSLTTQVSAGAAALFLANPLVGAAVGAGALLAQKILNNPIEQFFSYEYIVSGAWDDPVVQRATRRVSALKESPR